MIEIAYIDDNEDHLKIFEFSVRKWNRENISKIHLECFASPECFFKSPVDYDLVITDLVMKNTSGVSVFKWLIKRGHKMPVILLKSGALSSNNDFTVAISSDKMQIESVIQKYNDLKKDRLKNILQFNFCASKISKFVNG